MTALNSGKKTSSLVSMILKAGLLAGLLDICLAFLYSYIKRGTSPETVLQYIARVAFGKVAISNPTLLTVAGLLVHFAIAMCWTLLFFILYRTLRLDRINWIINGFLYGLIVWAMMSMLILPLWNDKPFTFNAEAAAINALILIVAIGLPISYSAHKYYSKLNHIGT